MLLVKQQVSLQLSLSRQALGRLHVAHLPRSQALSAHQLSRIKWRGIARTSFSYSSSLFRQTPQLIRQDI
jgi:hypothetical protein